MRGLLLKLFSNEYVILFLNEQLAKIVKDPARLAKLKKILPELVVLRDLTQEVIEAIEGN